MVTRHIKWVTWIFTDNVTQHWGTKWQWEGGIEASSAATDRTSVFTMGLELFTSRTTVSSSKRVWVRTECRSFVTLQPVEWSYQFSSTNSNNNNNMLFVPQFVTCEWAYCSWLRHLLEVAEYCLKCSLPNVMRFPLLQQCTEQYNSFIKQCSLSVMKFWR